MTWFLRGYVDNPSFGFGLITQQKDTHIFQLSKGWDMILKNMRHNKEENKEKLERLMSENPHGHYKTMVSWMTDIRMSYWWKIRKGSIDEMMTLCLDMSAIMIKVKVRLKCATLFPEIQITRKDQTFSPNEWHVSLKSSHTFR